MPPGRASLRSTITWWQMPSANRLVIACSTQNSRMTRCNSAAATVLAGITWSKLKTMRLASHRGRSRLRKASIASGPVTSCAIATSTSAMTVSPACTERPSRRPNSSSVMVPISIPLRPCPADDQCIEGRDVERAVVATSLHLGGEASQAGIFQTDAQCRGAIADRVPSGETVAGEDAALASEACGVQDLVGAGIGEHGLGVHARLVVKRRRRRHGRIERHGNPEDLREHRVQLPKHLEAVVLDQLWLDGHQSRHHRGERDDTVALPDAEDGRV